MALMMARLPYATRNESHLPNGTPPYNTHSHILQTRPCNFHKGMEEARSFIATNTATHWLPVACLRMALVVQLIPLVRIISGVPGTAWRLRHDFALRVQDHLQQKSFDVLVALLTAAEVVHGPALGTHRR